MTDGVLPLTGPETTMMNFLPSLLAKAGANANVDAAAQDFEAMFATQLLKPMFDTVPVNGVFGGGHGEEVMRTFLLQEYGKMIAKTGCLGIAHQVKGEMLRAQENAKARGGTYQPANNQNSSPSAGTKQKGISYAAS